MYELSRRTPARRMRNLLGRSPTEEITRVPLEVAKALRGETELSIVVIADRCGFAQPKYFSQVFHHQVGIPPRHVPPPGPAGEMTQATDPPRQAAAGWAGASRSSNRR